MTLDKNINQTEISIVVFSLRMLFLDFNLTLEQRGQSTKDPRAQGNTACGQTHGS